MSRRIQKSQRIRTYFLKYVILIIKEISNLTFWNGDFMKKYISLIIAYIILISCVVSVAAQNTATIVSEVINQEIKEEQMILIYINNNPGIMGFKLHFEYPEDAVEIISVHKGEVTSSGNFNNNIGNKNSSFDVMWNNTTDTILNGTIAILKVKVLTDEPFKIKLSFSQADTFNGNYEDVVFKCNDIVSSNSITETETTVETVTKNEDEVIDVTDDVIFDIVIPFEVGLSDKFVVSRLKQKILEFNNKYFRGRQIQ